MRAEPRGQLRFLAHLVAQGIPWARKENAIPSFTTRPCMTYDVGMGESDKRKQSLYFPEEMLKEISDEATRQDRSLSWIIQKAWKTARKEIMAVPSINEISSGGTSDARAQSRRAMHPRAAAGASARTGPRLP